MKIDVPTLAPGMIHVWELNLDHLVFGEVLSDEEQARAAKFRFDHDRKRFATGRTALRQLIGAYLKTAPEKIEIAYGVAGKPSVGNGALSFNLAHSGAHALAAFASNGQVGVDIEEIRAMDDLETVAQFSFSDGEFRRWKALPAEQRMRAFFRCWTRKEAYLKAIGEGIAKRLKAFEVAFEAGEPPRILRGAEGEWTLIDASRENCAAAIACDFLNPELQRFSLASV